MGPATSSVPVSVSSSNMSDPFPEIKSKHSLVARYVTQPIWEKLSRAVTKTSGFSLSQAIACAVQFDNQHCGIYAGDWDSYKVFADGFGLSPGITREQRLGVENLMKKAFSNLKGDLAGTYYPLTGMNEQVRQQLVDDHFLFVSGDRNLIAAGMERDW